LRSYSDTLACLCHFATIEAAFGPALGARD
jgi:hypothetical protein